MLRFSFVKNKILKPIRFSTSTNLCSVRPFDKLRANGDLPIFHTEPTKVTELANTKATCE